MKKTLRILGWIFGIIFIINLLIVISGNSYLYQAFYYQGANIDDFKVFNNRIVAAGNSHDLPLSKQYNKVKPDSNFTKFLKQFQTKAFLVVKNDSIVYEEYWDGYNIDSYLNSFSVAKSIVSILAGIALDEGKISSLDQKVSDFIPEYRNGLNAQLKIRDLLTMSAGFDWKETYSNPFTLTAKAYFGGDLVHMIKHLEVTEQPGIYFNYQSASTLVLAYVIEKSSGLTLSDFASEKLWKPLGAKNNALWSIDNASGFEKAFCCFNANIRDFAKIGLLALHNGNYNGTRIVSENYIKRSVEPAPVNDYDGNPVDFYGYSWWLGKAASQDLFYAEGILGQYIIVVPAENLVILRFGEKYLNIDDRNPAELLTELTINNF